MQLLNDVFIPLLDIFGCLVVIFFVSLFIGWLLGFSRKNELSKCDDEITAVLYDSKVERVVKMVQIKEHTTVLYLPKLEEARLKFVEEVFEPAFPEIKIIRFDFFCIQDDGKHIFIERG